MSESSTQPRQDGRADEVASTASEAWMGGAAHLPKPATPAPAKSHRSSVPSKNLNRPVSAQSGSLAAKQQGQPLAIGQTSLEASESMPEGKQELKEEGQGEVCQEGPAEVEEGHGSRRSSRASSGKASGRRTSKQGHSELQAGLSGVDGAGLINNFWSGRGGDQTHKQQGQEQQKGLQDHSQQASHGRSGSGVSRMQMDQGSQQGAGKQVRFLLYSRSLQV
jgi:hypothetical protein